MYAKFHPSEAAKLLSWLSRSLADFLHTHFPDFLPYILRTYSHHLKNFLPYRIVSNFLNIVQTIKEQDYVLSGSP
jgi:hypothetical protein